MLNQVRWWQDAYLFPIDMGMYQGGHTLQQSEYQNLDEVEEAFHCAGNNITLIFHVDD